MIFENYSILQKFKKFMLIEYPFPHIVIENCLPEDLYLKLTETIPYELINYDKFNSRGDIYLNQLNNEDKFFIWKKFLEYHSSENFLNEVLGILRNYIDKDTLHKIYECKKKINIYPIENNDELSMSSSFSYNTPVKSPSSVRGIHRDKPNKLYGALLYMRDDDDETNGGDLELYSKNKVVKKISYKKNTLVLFLNNEHSFHGVSKRDITDRLRKFCYFSTICPFSLFSKNSNLLNRIKKREDHFVEL